MKSSWYVQMIFHFLLIMAMSTAPAFAGDSVHFGSIFTEEHKASNTLEDKETLNKITENTAQQKTLEEIHPDLKETNDRARQINNVEEKPYFTNSAIYPDQTPRTQLAPEGNNETSSKVGMVKNAELKPKVVYFLELRPIPGNTPKNLFVGANTYNNSIGKIYPGEMVKVTDTSDEFIQKLRMDRDNQGLWRKVGHHELGAPSDLYVYYDWKNFDTIPVATSAIDLDILIPQKSSSIPVFSRPGAWTWKDCQIGIDVCTDRIDQHVQAYLLDSNFAMAKDLRTQQDIVQLYYKIGYKLIDKAGTQHTRIGWIPSYYARRKIISVPRNILSLNTGAHGFETDAERAERLNKYYVFQGNVGSENKIISRWLKKEPGSDDEVFDNTFSYDALIGYNNFNMQQSFLDDKFKQSSVSVGLGIYAPIYVDLEAQGTVTFSVPVSHAPQDIYPNAPLFRGDQWLMYTTPIGLEKTPIKVGLGIYYLSMFESQTDFGFKSFVGFQGKIGVENEYFWIDFRFGPTGQDFNFNMNNRELGSSLGVRLNPSMGMDSLTLFMDYSQTNYRSPVSGHTTDFNIFNLGIRKTFW